MRKRKKFRIIFCRRHVCGILIKATRGYHTIHKCFFIWKSLYEKKKSKHILQIRRKKTHHSTLHRTEHLTVIKLRMMFISGDKVIFIVIREIPKIHSKKKVPLVVEIWSFYVIEWGIWCGVRT